MILCSTSGNVITEKPMTKVDFYFLWRKIEIYLINFYKNVNVKRSKTKKFQILWNDNKIISCVYS